MPRPQGDPLGLRLARVGTGLFAAALALLVVYVIASRVAYPYELEWMTGAVRDHVMRARVGEPIYVAPSLSFTPFLYTPGYYYVSSWVSRIVPMILACRLVSVGSSLSIAWGVFRLSRLVGATYYWALLATGLFVSSFSFTCFWFDIERADPLFVALLIAASCALLRKESSLSAVAAGGLFGLAFLVKQPATMVAFCAACGLLVLREFRRLGLFALAAGSVVLPIAAFLQISTGGWFAYYCLRMPARHGMEVKYVTLFFVSDASKGFLLTLATLATGVLGARNAVRAFLGAQALRRRETLFACLLVGAFAASASSRLHLGGWPNVLLFWVPFACVAVALGASQIDSALRGISDRGLRVRVQALVLALVCAQLGLFAVDPSESIPTREAWGYELGLRNRIRELEKERGEVVALARGGLTSVRHAHIAALADVVRSGGVLPEAFRNSLERRHCGAIILDEWPGGDMRPVVGVDSELFEAISANYILGEILDDRLPPPIVGFGSIPRWVFFPRRFPLRLSRAGLQRRQLIERGLAEANLRAVQAGIRPRFDDVEREAALLDASPEGDIGR